MLELMRFHQTPSAIVFEDEPVTPYVVSTRVLLRIFEVVFDQFEDNSVARKRKHEHHHAARSFGSDKPIARGAQVPDEIAVELGLAVTVVTNCVVKIDSTFPRHELTQAAHEFIWTRGIDAKISARERKQNSEVGLPDKERVEIEFSFGFVGDSSGDVLNAA